MSRIEEFHNVTNSSPSVPRNMWSPFHRALALVTIFAMVFGGVLLTQPGNASAQSAATVTDYLNLRSGPSTGDSIISVMGPGASVSLDGGSQNGFLSLTYNGSWGWAHADWISTGGASAPAPSQSATGSATVIDGALNLRGGPSTGYSVITVMPGGAQVSLTGESAGGFLSVVYNGTAGWASAEYLSTGAAPAPSQPAPTSPGNGAIGDTVVGSMRTTDSLNMRSGPSTSNTIITTVPSGNTVEIMGDPQNGFYPARFGGNKGWMFGEWLTFSSTTPTPTQPAPTTPAPSTGLAPGVAARTTTRLILRTEPNTSSTVITVLVNGATVEITGTPQNGFYPVKYGNNSGWMHGDWLTTQGAGVPGPPSEAPLPNPTAPAPETVGDTVVGTMNVTTGLNLRQGPGTNYDVVVVMPGGVSVSVMGQPVNGFYPLQFHGSKGWASGDYLTTGVVNVPNPGNGDYTRDELIQIIYAAADKYDQPRADMLRVAQCESVLDPNVVNPASGVSGLFQFLPSTWATTPYRNEDIFDPVANSEAAAWMWANGRRNEWHCQ